MKQLLCLLAFMFCLTFLSGQNYNKIDSLKKVLKTLPELNGTDADTARMKTSMLIGKLFERYIPDSAMFYYRAAIDTSIFSDEKVFKTAVNTYKGKHDLNTNSMYLLGLQYVYMGDYQASRNLWLKSEKIFEELNNMQGVSKCLNGLSNIAWNQGDYPNSVMHLEKSLKIKQEINDTSGIPYAMNNLGLIVMYQGNYKKATEYFENALLLSEKLKDKKVISTSLSNLGIVTANLGDYKKSIEYYERSLKIAEEIRDKKIISNILGSIGSCYYQNGDLDKALEYDMRSMKIKEELKDRKGISTCYKDIGNVAYRKKDYLSTIENYNRSIKIKEELGSLADLAGDLPVLAKSYIMLDSADKALGPLLKSNEISVWLLKNNFTILGETEKEMYLNQTQKIFNDLLAYNFLYSNIDSLSGICYNNELMLKGLLLKSTSAVINTVYRNSDPVLKEAYVLMKQYRSQISAMQASGKPVKESDIRLLENKAAEQEQKLVKLSSVFSGIDNLFNNKWEDVQKNLKPGEAAIEFVKFTYGADEDSVMYAALVITTGSKKPVTVKLFSDIELQNILGRSEKTGYDYINTLYLKNSNTLYSLIWKPLEPVLSGIKTVYYAPVGVLNKISFAALLK